MSRSARKWAPGRIFHVMNRRVDGKPLFLNTEDYCVFMSLMEEAQDKFNCYILAWCLMTNHFHILIQIGDRPPGIFMQWLQMKYVIYYNKKYQRSGVLFQSRYTSVIARDEPYLVEASRYIHLNPVKAGMVSDPLRYTYSSYHEYMHPGEMDRMPTVYTNQILSMFGNDHPEINYQHFVEDRNVKHKLQDTVIRDISEADKPAAKTST